MDNQSKKDLEQGLLDNLQEFLLELGKGFSFVARQKRITIDGDHYYIDLVFYNYILKCFVLIDLKTGKLSYQDIGQIDFYVRYFEDQVKAPEDNPTIGIVRRTKERAGARAQTFRRRQKRRMRDKHLRCLSLIIIFSGLQVLR